MIQLLECVQDRLPFRNGLARHERLEASEQRSPLLPGRHASLILGRDAVVLLIFGPVTMGGHVGRRHREPALGDEAERAGHDAGSLLVLAAAVSHQDQGASPGGAFWRPQHAGNITEGKELLKDAAGRRLGGEAHSVQAFRDAFAGTPQAKRT